MLVHGPSSLAAGVSTSLAVLAGVLTFTSVTVYVVAVSTLLTAMLAVATPLPAAWLMAGLAGVPVRSGRVRCKALRCNTLCHNVLRQIAVIRTLSHSVAQLCLQELWSPANGKAVPTNCYDGSLCRPVAHRRAVGSCRLELEALRRAAGPHIDQLQAGGTLVHGRVQCEALGRSHHQAVRPDGVHQ